MIGVCYKWVVNKNPYLIYKIVCWNQSEITDVIPQLVKIRMEIVKKQYKFFSDVYLKTAKGMCMVIGL